MKKDTIEELTPKEWLSPQIKLQLYYRKAFEYASANGLEASHNKLLGNILTFVTLVLSTTTSILLLRGNNGDQGIIVVGAIFSAIVTGLTGFNSFMKYSQKYEEHANSVAEFSKIQRSIVNDLQTKNEQEFAKSFDSNAKAFGSARENMPLIAPDRLDKYKNKEGATLFHKIREGELMEERKKNIKGKSRPPPPTLPFG